MFQKLKHSTALQMYSVAFQEMITHRGPQKPNM